jgi:hypothetical protein
MKFIKYALRAPIGDLFHLRRPHGIIRITACVMGYIDELRTPRLRAIMIFVADKPRKPVLQIMPGVRARCGSGECAR